MPLLKTTFVFNFLFISLFIIPFASFVLSFISFYYIKPHTQSFTPMPSLHSDNVVFDCTVNSNCKSTVYTNILLPETPKNFESFSTYMNVNGSNVYLTMKYRPPIFMLIDTLLFFPLIKLNIYNQEQRIIQEIMKLEPGMHDIKISMKDRLKFTSFTIDVIEECSQFQILIYKYELLYKFVMYLVTFFVFFFVVLYIAVVLYRKLSLSENHVYDEMIEDGNE